MAILVTGGAGYIGSHTTCQLLEAGYKVVVLDDLSTGNRWAVPEQAVFVEGDIGNRELVRDLLRKHEIRSVIHFAGSIQVGESVALPMKYYLNNTVNTHSLLQSCMNEGVLQFVFSSTAAVYGSPKILPVSESSPVDPQSPYGSSKLMSEWILRDLVASYAATLPANQRFRYVALRYFNVAGAQLAGNLGQTTRNATHLIKVACEAACRARESVSILGTDYPTPDGTGVRDYIHVEDLARAHLDAIRYLDAGGDSEIMNCGYGHGFSVREVLSMVKKVSGVDFKVVEAPRRPGDTGAVVAEASRIQQLLNWTPRYNDLETICRTAYLWEKKLRSPK